MFKVLFLFSIVCVSVLEAKPVDDDNQNGVVGEKDAKVNEFPYMVSLRKIDNHDFCGGSILNARTILTAAHCVHHHKADELMIIVGSVYRNSGGTKYLISNITLHPDYNKPFVYANDIAILTTSEPITTSSSVGFIDLPTSITGAGVKVTLTGWGLAGETSSPNTLQKIILLTISDQDCKNKYVYGIDDTNMCTLTKDGERARRGDSGGPLTDGNVLVGIVSRGRPWSKGYPDVYVRVSSYIPWINNNSHS